jgi:hypothetical protein
MVHISRWRKHGNDLHVDHISRRRKRRSDLNTRKCGAAATARLATDRLPATNVVTHSQI